MKHQIRKQVISLQIDGGQSAFFVQQQAKDYYYYEIIPVFEKLFDELSTDNEIVQIEKLEIDLGNLKWRNDKFSIDREAVYHIMKRSLEEALGDYKNNDTNDIKINYKTLEENSCVQWIDYMQNGILPWQLQVTDKLWAENVIHQLAIDHRQMEKTKQLILNHQWFLERLVREHTDTFLQQLAEVITAKNQQGLTTRLLQIINKLNLGDKDRLIKRNKVWEQILEQFTLGKTFVDIEELLLVPSKKQSRMPEIEKKGLIDEEFFCHNAGLLLLHPFYSQLFHELELLSDKTFKNNETRSKAVQLLYFIATGKTEPSDYELVVAKVICGMPVHELLSRDTSFLTELEMQEATLMMKAAVEQWPTMESTSPDALREGFLTREGKLLMTNNGTKFRIKTQGIDVLLDRLPWNLSLIRLSWLKDFIHVEWR